MMINSSLSNSDASFEDTKEPGRKGYTLDEFDLAVEVYEDEIQQLEYIRTER